MAEKNFFADKWLKDQFNERNPGQRNCPRTPATSGSDSPTAAPRPSSEAVRQSMTVPELVADLTRSCTIPTEEEIDRIIAEGSDMEVALAANLTGFIHPRLRKEHNRRKRRANAKRLAATSRT